MITIRAEDLVIEDAYLAGTIITSFGYSAKGIIIPGELSHPGSDDDCLRNGLYFQVDEENKLCFGLGDLFIGE